MNEDDFVQVDDAGRFIRFLPRHEVLAQLTARRADRTLNKGPFSLRFSGRANDIQKWCEPVSLLADNDKLAIGAIDDIAERPEWYRPLFETIAAKKGLESLDIAIVSPAPLILLSSAFQEIKEDGASCISELTFTILHHDATGVDYQQIFPGLLKNMRVSKIRLRIHHRDDTVIGEVLAGLKNCVSQRDYQVHLHFDLLADSHISFLKTHFGPATDEPFDLNVSQLRNLRWKSIVDLFSIVQLCGLAFSRVAMPTDLLTQHDKERLALALRDMELYSAFEIPSWFLETFLLAVERASTHRERCNRFALFIPQGVAGDYDILLAHAQNIDNFDSLKIPFISQKLDTLFAAISKTTKLYKLELTIGENHDVRGMPLEPRFQAIIRRNCLIRDECHRHFSELRYIWHYESKNWSKEEKIYREKVSMRQIVRDFRQLSKRETSFDDEVNKEGRDSIAFVKYGIGLSAQYLLVQTRLAPLLFPLCNT